MGVWSFRRATGKAASASDSMTPRAAGIRTFIPAPLRTVGIIPAHNEMASLARVVAEIRENCPELDLLVVGRWVYGRERERAGASWRGDICRCRNVSAWAARCAPACAMPRGSATTPRFASTAMASTGGADIERLLEPLRSGIADVSLGSRFLQDGAGHGARPRVTRMAQSRSRSVCLR
jgi:hypothetical protein